MANNQGNNSRVGGGTIEVSSDNDRFDVRKYQNENLTLIDGTDALANLRGLVISFQHVPSGRSVFFKAFITSFNETYSSNFTPNEAFGRTDPIYQYKNTTRKITLAFKAPAASESEAYENLGKISALEQMLYPNYSDVDSATTLAQAPLIRIKVMNLLSKNYELGPPSEYELRAAGSNTDKRSPRRIQYDSYNSGGSQPGDGLLGIIESLSVNHNLEGDDGVFFKRQEQEGTATPVRNTILPKFIDVNLSFAPIHEQTLGWNNDNTAMQSLFPYGIVSDDTIPDEIGPANVAYNEQVEKAKADNLRQQTIANARARYSGVLGDMRMKADVRRGSRGNEAAKASLRARSEVLREDMQARMELLNATGIAGDQFLEESGD